MLALLPLILRTQADALKTVPVIVPTDWPEGIWLPAGVAKSDHGWESHAGRIFSVVAGAESCQMPLKRQKQAMEENSRRFGLSH